LGTVLGCVVASAPPVDYQPSDVQLLARMITAEARGEDEQGQIAVGWVAVNRARRPSWWGKTLDGVLHKPFQFALSSGFTAAAEMIAAGILSGDIEDNTSGATHFHHGRLPGWAASFIFVGRIGKHQFYRKPGGCEDRAE